MYGTPYIFHFVHPLVKTAEIMVQRVNFEQNLKNICPPTVSTTWPKILYRRQTDVFKISFKIDPLKHNFGRFY